MRGFLLRLDEPLHLFLSCRRSMSEGPPRHLPTRSDQPLAHLSALTRSWCLMVQDELLIQSSVTRICTKKSSSCLPELLFSTSAASSSDSIAKPGRWLADLNLPGSRTRLTYSVLVEVKNSINILQKGRSQDHLIIVKCLMSHNLTSTEPIAAFWISDV